MDHYKDIILVFLVTHIMSSWFVLIDEMEDQLRVLIVPDHPFDLRDDDIDSRVLIFHAKTF